MRSDSSHPTNAAVRDADRCAADFRSRFTSFTTFAALVMTASMGCQQLAQAQLARAQLARANTESILITTPEVNATTWEFRHGVNRHTQQPEGVVFTYSHQSASGGGSSSDTSYPDNRRVAANAGAFLHTNRYAQPDYMEPLPALLSIRCRSGDAIAVSIQWPEPVMDNVSPDLVLQLDNQRPSLHRPVVTADGHGTLIGAGGQLLTILLENKQLFARVRFSNGNDSATHTFSLDGLAARLLDACAWHPDVTSLAITLPGGTTIAPEPMADPLDIRLPQPAQQAGVIPRTTTSAAVTNTTAAAAATAPAPVTDPDAGELINMEQAPASMAQLDYAAVLAQAVQARLLQNAEGNHTASAVCQVSVGLTSRGWVHQLKITGCDGSRHVSPMRQQAITEALLVTAPLVAQRDTVLRPTEQRAEFSVRLN